MANNIITPNVIAMAVSLLQSAALASLRLMYVWNEAKEQDSAKMMDPSWLTKPLPLEIVIGPAPPPTIGPATRVQKICSVNNRKGDNKLITQEEKTQQ